MLFFYSQNMCLGKYRVVVLFLAIVLEYLRNGILDGNWLGKIFLKLYGKYIVFFQIVCIFQVGVVGVVRIFGAGIKEDKK